MIGQKGLPATYGGVEHHVEAVGQRLAKRGHEITVFSRKYYGKTSDAPYLGMHIKSAPTIASKHLDAIVHSVNSTVLAMRQGFDVIHYHALGPGLAAALPRYASRTGVVLTVHGLDHERAKWGGPARAALGLAYRFSARVPTETIVVSQALRERYQRDFGKDVVYITNGADEPLDVPPDALSEFGLEPGKYLLFVGRMVPEKAPASLVEAYRSLDTNHKLVLVGDSSFTDGYTSELRRLAANDPRVILPGYIHGDRLKALYQYTRLFLLPSLLEGLPLTLLEAISHAVPVLASDIEPHREVLRCSAGSVYSYFSAGDVASLSRTLAQVLAAPAPEAADLRSARESILRSYNWDDATDALEDVYLRVARARVEDNEPIPGT